MADRAEESLTAWRVSIVYASGRTQEWYASERITIIRRPEIGTVTLAGKAVENAEELRDGKGEEAMVEIVVANALWWGVTRVDVREEAGLV